MEWRRTLAVVSFVVLALSAFLPAARADEYNEKMELTFNEPVEVPGLVLPAGTYWFVLADIPYCRNVMRIYNDDWSKLYATLITISAYRQQQQNQPEVRLAVRPHPRAQALLQMYYPSLQLGHEFLYADHEEGELRHDAELTVMVRPAGETSSINFRSHSWTAK
jgi:hypothetical protein